MGFEPTTFCMASRRSSQLSYSRPGRPSIASASGPHAPFQRRNSSIATGGAEPPRGLASYAEKWVFGRSALQVFPRTSSGTASYLAWSHGRRIAKWTLRR